MSEFDTEIDGAEVRIKPSPSSVQAGYGAVKPTRCPEDWKQVHEEIERAMAEEVAQEA